MPSQVQADGIVLTHEDQTDAEKQTDVKMDDDAAGVKLKEALQDADRKVHSSQETQNLPTLYNSIMPQGNPFTFITLLFSIISSTVLTLWAIIVTVTEDVRGCHLRTCLCSCHPASAERLKVNWTILSYPCPILRPDLQNWSAGQGRADHTRPACTLPPFPTRRSALHPHIPLGGVLVKMSFG